MKKVGKILIPHTDREVLKAMAVGKDLIVELGTGEAESTVLLAVAKRVVTIDIFEKYPHIFREGVSTKYNEMKKILNPYPNIEVVCALSYEYAINFKDDSIDLLFVDSSHDYVTVKREFDCYLPKIKKDGFILFHDYNEIHPEVVDAVNQIILTGLVRDSKINRKYMDCSVNIKIVEKI